MKKSIYHLSVIYEYLGSIKLMKYKFIMPYNYLLSKNNIL